MICTLYALPKTCPKKRVDSAIPHSSKHTSIQASRQGVSPASPTHFQSAKPTLNEEGQKPSSEASPSPSIH